MRSPDRRLDYLPPTPWHRRTAVRRAALGAAVFAAALLLALRWGPFAWRRAHLLWAQRQCLQHVAPSGQVIYASDPAEDHFDRSEAKAVKQPPPPYWNAFRPELPPAPVRSVGEHFLDSGFDPLAPAPVFLHRRSTSDSERLVVVLFGQQLLGGKSHRVLCHRVIRPATFTRGPATLSEGSTILASSFEWTASVRVFAGQADPSDPSRFTIEVEVSGKAKTFDGRLKDDDSMELRLRDRTTRPDA